MFKKFFGTESRQSEVSDHGFNTPDKRLRQTDIFRANDRPYSRQGGFGANSQPVDLFAVDIPDPTKARINTKDT